MGVSPRYKRSSNLSINLNLRFRVMSTSAGGRDATGPPPDGSSTCDRRARRHPDIENREAAEVDLGEEGLDGQHLLAQLVGATQAHDARRPQAQLDLAALGEGHADGSG